MESMGLVKTCNCLLSNTPSILLKKQIDYFCKLKSNTIYLPRVAIREIKTSCYIYHSDSVINYCWLESATCKQAGIASGT